MPLEIVGADEVRRQLARLTHAILTGGAGFVIQYYGRPVAYLGPANAPDLAAQAAACIAAGQPERALALLGRIPGAGDGRPA